VRRQYHRPKFRLRDNLQVSQCLTKRVVYILPVETGSSASSGLYRVPLGEACPLKASPKVEFPISTIFSPSIGPGTEPAGMGLILLVKVPSYHEVHAT
jgi:hypothetical protein